LAKANIQSLAEICKKIVTEIPQEFYDFFEQILDEVKEFEAKIDPYCPTFYEDKYRDIKQFTYDVLVDLHYDVITCANAARRTEWLVFPYNSP